MNTDKARIPLSHVFLVFLIIVALPFISGCGKGEKASPTIVGTISYQDKEYDESGFTGNAPYKAVRYAAVELVSESTSNVLNSSLTDANGAFSFSTSPTETVYLRVNAEVSLSGSTPQVAVKNLSGGIYAVASDTFAVSGLTTINISIPTSSPASGAFNILDVFTTGLQFTHDLSGSYPSSALYAFWESGSTGTYYCTSYDSVYCVQDEGIYVLNSTDRYRRIRR